MPPPGSVSLSPSRAAMVPAVLGLLLVAAACDEGVPRGDLEIVEILPHDTSAYTQGLVLHDGVLYESTGRYGSSSVRRVDPSTGEVLARADLPEAYFGEGLDVVEGRLVQLTWKEGVALLHDPATLELRDSIPLTTDGWGLCFDGTWLWSTDGSSILWRRDPETLATEGRVQVLRDGRSLQQVNELECVDEHILANVFQSTSIVRIDKATGEVVAEWDAAGLVPDALRGSAEAVLNGIAWDRSTDTFLLTGKLWPVMYRVRLRPPGGGG